MRPRLEFDGSRRRLLAARRNGLLTRHGIGYRPTRGSLPPAACVYRADGRKRRRCEGRPESPQLLEREGGGTVKTEYLELTRSIERLHRRFLDVLRAELNRIGSRDINGVQVLLLANIGEEEIAIRDLIERGYYQGSNVSYNIKKLAEMGYLTQRRSDHDRRSVTVALTEKAKHLVQRIRDLEDRIADQLGGLELGTEQIGSVCQALRGVERTWTDYIHFGGR
jgi:DNA-binding MarR family transcriptional regulator